MDTDSQNPAKRVRVAVLALPGVVPLDLVLPLQVFGPWPDYLVEQAGTASPYEVELVAEPDARVGDWLQVADPAPLTRIATADTVVVPGVVDPSAPLPDASIAAIAAAHRAGARIVSICTGAFALAAAGILDGRPATTHWQWASALAERHPAVEVRAQQLFVDDDDVVTSAGILAGADVCLHIVRRDLGQRAGNALARFLVSPPQREGGQAQYTIEPATERGELSHLTDWILTHLDEPLTLEVIARRAHSSVRTLSRRFRAAYGVSVMDWIVRQRVARARELLETTERPVSEIGFACGFGSLESFRINFAEHALTSPLRYRATFR